MFALVTRLEGFHGFPLKKDPLDPWPQPGPAATLLLCTGSSTDVVWRDADWGSVSLKSSAAWLQGAKNGAIDGDIMQGLALLFSLFT